MKQSDFCQPFATSLISKILRCNYRLSETGRSPGYASITFVRSPRSIDPDGFSPPSRYRLVLSACGKEDYLGFRSVYLTGLYRFTVSHCGSRTPMPTLKPHLTALAPRLSTDCSLRFAGRGLSPHCITCTEPAHPSSEYCIIPISKIQQQKSS